MTDLAAALSALVAGRARLDVPRPGSAHEPDPLAAALDNLDALETIASEYRVFFQ